MKVKDLKAKLSKLDDNLELVNTYGDPLEYLIKFKTKLILSEEKPKGKCRKCNGPIYLDNVTSFEYVCPNENINKYKSEIDVKL